VLLYPYAGTSVCAVPAVVVSGSSSAATATSSAATSSAATSSVDTVAADVYALAVQQISPLPKSKVQRQRKRKTEGAAVVTSSPYKQQLLDKEKKKQQKTSRGVTKCSPKKCEKKSKKMTCRADKSKPPQYPTKPRPRKSKVNQKQNNGSNFEEEAEYECMMCGECFANSRPGEPWIQCKKCSSWCHEDCSSGETSSGFVCDFCRPN